MPGPMSIKTAMPIDNCTVKATKASGSSGLFLWKLHLGAIALMASVLTGCGEGDPFPLEQITGKVTYSDGSLIKAGTIQIICKSMDVESVKGKSPRGAKGKLDPETGEFSALTTWKANDGVICGRNKVAIVPMEYGKGIDQMGRPARNLLAQKYFKTSTTDLEIDVVSGGENHFELTVEKPNK